MLREGTLRPESFINPSLPVYALLPFVGLQQKAAAAGLLSGRAADPMVVGRVMSALAGALAVLVLGLAVLRTHPALGCWPSVLLALAPGFVNLCHFATPEAWLMLGAAGTLAVALAHLAGRAPAWTVGLVLGLTVSTKHTAVALLAPCLAAVCFRDPRADPSARPSIRRTVPVLALGLVLLALGLALGTGPGAALAAHLRLRDPRLLPIESAHAFVRALAAAALLAGVALATIAALAAWGWRWAGRGARPEIAALLGAAALGFAIGTPYALLDPSAVLSGMAFNYETRLQYKGLTGEPTSFLAYLALLADAVTGPLLIAGAIGLLVALGRALERERASVVLLLSVVAPYVLVSSSGHRAMRFLAPVLPALAWTAALALAAIAAPRARRLATALVAGRAALATLLVLRLFFVDARVVAERWIAAHVPAGATVDVIANHLGYAPRAPEGRSFRVVPTLSREMAPPERFAEAAARYRDEGGPWLVLTASYYERFLLNPGQRPERTAFFTDLLDGRGGYEMVARFQQSGWRRPPAEFLDPEIVILRKRP